MGCSFRFLSQVSVKYWQFTTTFSDLPGRDWTYWSLQYWQILYCLEVWVNNILSFTFNWEMTLITDSYTKAQPSFEFLANFAKVSDLVCYRNMEVEKLGKPSGNPTLHVQIGDSHTCPKGNLPISPNCEPQIRNWEYAWSHMEEYECEPQRLQIILVDDKESCGEESPTSQRPWLWF